MNAGATFALDISAQGAATVAAVAPAVAWHDRWYFAQADWPSLALNTVVLGLAVYGVVQAHAANRQARTTDRRLFQIGKFKSFEERMARSRIELEALSELLLELETSLTDDKDFASEVDHLGSILFPHLLGFRRALDAIDKNGDFGQGWVNTFIPFRDRAEAAYDTANNATFPRPQRQSAAGLIAAAIQDGLRAVDVFEFTQQQTWGSRL